MNDNREYTALIAAQNAAKRLVKLIDLKAPKEVIEGEAALINKFIEMHNQEHTNNYGDHISGLANACEQDEGA